MTRNAEPNDAVRSKREPSNARRLALAARTANAMTVLLINSTAVFTEPNAIKV